MQMLALILSFIFGRMNKQTSSLKDSALEIFEDVIHRSRKVVALTLAALAMLIFFCGGLFISIFNATSQFDQAGYVQFTATLAAGIVLVLLGAVGFILVLGRAWPDAKARLRVQEEIHTQPTSGLVQALSILVLDFVKERELTHKAKQTKEPPESTAIH